jgi:hypothetical protein
VLDPHVLGEWVGRLFLPVALSSLPLIMAVLMLIGARRQGLSVPGPGTVEAPLPYAVAVPGAVEAPIVPGQSSVEVSAPAPCRPVLRIVRPALVSDGLPWRRVGEGER